MGIALASELGDVGAGIEGMLWLSQGLADKSVAECDHVQQRRVQIKMGCNLSTPEPAEKITCCHVPHCRQSMMLEELLKNVKRDSAREQGRD